MTFQDEEEVVISGIGGKFAHLGNSAELEQKLFAGESLLTKDERILTKGFYENLPEHHGKAQNNSVMFDNTFFGISAIVAAAMDPLTCQILQRTFEAVIDAGINPSELRGTNAAVFSGTCHSDSDLEWATDTRAGYGIMGRNRCMNSNRVSYWLDLNGTSVSTDSGWTNGLSNLYLAWDAIRKGRCDTALVSTASLQCHALITIQLKDFGVLSPDGLSRTFDDGANGTGRSSAVVVLVLQRASVARRSYATIGHVLSTCYGDRDEIINKPSRRDWAALFEEFYSQSKIDVNDVVYVEAHGSSIREEDAEEVNAMTEVFCKNRKSPLLIGCVRSNMGNTEAASAFCGIVKALIALERGMIPQNLNYSTPNSLCPGLAKGQIKVVEKSTPIPADGWIAVSSHGFGGTYAHVVLKANPKSKLIKCDSIPRLVLLADRTNDYISDMIQKVESVPYDPEYVALLHEIHSKKMDKYLARGYTILPKQENPIHEHQVFGEEKRPVWFVFSGMGSQWPEMGKRLMDFPLFRKSIEKSHEILKDKGLDLIHIITTNDPKIFENILHSFVGIAAVQVALVDILKTLKVIPDGIIGHSVGELGCAYADGCFSAEQMILAAYYRGRASTEAELIKGSMAAVGKGYKDIKDELPEGIEVACHNSDDSCTLSGPVDLIHKYVAELKEKGVFARSVNVSNIAYHSRYIKPAAPRLLEYLKQIVTQPKLRSSKWISTSNPESKWDTELAKYCSAEYHTNNLLNSVLFEEGSKHIPENAICIEIAPHGLLQAILKRSLGEKVTNIPLTSRSTDDPLTFLLQAIGKMYMAGIDPCVIDLYPKVEYPVSRGTHILHDLVHWHEQLTATAVTPMERKVVYSFKNRLVETAVDGTGYTANEQNIYPISVFLTLTWEIFAASRKKSMKECPVVFQNFRIEHPVTVHLSEDDNGTVSFLYGTGDFEIQTDHVLARGNISELKDKTRLSEVPKMSKEDLIGDEIYQEIRRKGYGVGESFKNLSAVSITEKELMGEMTSSIDWAQNIESFIQLFLLQSADSLDSMAFPYAFNRLEIASLAHEKYKNSVNSLPISYDRITNSAVCGGIMLKGLKAVDIPRTRSQLKFESTNFMPFVNPPLENSLQFAEFCFGVVLDDIGAIKAVTDVNIIEVTEEKPTLSIGCYLQQQFRDYKVTVKTVPSTLSETANEHFYELIISPGNEGEKLARHLVDGGFMLLNKQPGKKTPSGLMPIGKYTSGSNEEFVLLKKAKANSSEDSEFISIEGNQGQLMKKLKGLKKTEKNVYLVGNKEPIEGIQSFRQRIQAETPVPLRWIFILDSRAPPFDSKTSVYSEHLKKGLSTNVYNNGQWGGFCLFNFSESSFPEDVNLAFEWPKEITPSYLSLDFNENLSKLQQVEFSGKMNHAKVMGIAKLANKRKLVLDKYLTWEIPESWSLEDGASTSLSYALAYYCLVVEKRVLPYEKVLVTDGMTCLGRACIAVALTLAKRVLVTVANEKEIPSIKKLFPQLDENDIMSHEDPKFDLAWKLKMKNEYAEVIINMLDGDHFFSVLNCTGQYGKVYHFGRDNITKNKQLGTSVFLLSLVLYVRTPDIITKLSESQRKQMHELMANGIKSGVVKPLPRLTFSMKEFKKIQSKGVKAQKQTKTLLVVNPVKPNQNLATKFCTNNSFLILGDETDAWVDIAEWLISEGTENIIVSRRDNTKRSQLRTSLIRSHKNVFIHDGQNVETLLEEAKKLGTLSAVYYLAMTSPNENHTLLTLDEKYRIPSGHLVALSRTQGFVSEVCRRRNKAGYPSSNFVWSADQATLQQNLGFMSMVTGRDPVIYVSPVAKFSVSEYGLSSLLPTCLDDFCDFGSILDKEVQIRPLGTLAGLDRTEIKESTPLIFIPGLHKDPVKLLEPIARGFMYPSVCVQIPDIRLPIPKMASFILPSIIKFNKGDAYNLVGVSFGTHLAMELAKRLEETGATVGLTLIEGPHLNTKALISKSLETDLINLIQGYSKTSANVKVQSEVLPEKTWTRQLNKALTVLNLPPEKEKHFCRAAMFIYHNLQMLMSHDAKSINLKGPVNVIVNGQQSFDEKIIWQLSKSISIVSLPHARDKSLNVPEMWTIVHGAAVSQAMSPNTIHSCSWPFFEHFINQKADQKLSEDFQPINMKFSFTC